MHDYGDGKYFITICTHQHEIAFGNISNNVMHLNELGQYVEKGIIELHKHHPYAIVDTYVIMPNHIHMIIEIIKLQTPYKKRGKLVKRITSMTDCSYWCGWLSTTIGCFKSWVTKFARSKGFDFHWQTRFHDHIIRSSEEYHKIKNYILSNVANWKNDCFHK